MRTSFSYIYIFHAVLLSIFVSTGKRSRKGILDVLMPNFCSLRTYKKIFIFLIKRRKKEIIDM